MEDKEKIKMAIIAGASRALFHKNQKRMISDSDILRKVVDEINEIARTINSN